MVKDVLKCKKVDRKKTFALKNRRNWKKEEENPKWITRHIGEMEFKVKKIDRQESSG